MVLGRMVLECQQNQVLCSLELSMVLLKGYNSTHNIYNALFYCIYRSLLTENFLPLGKWFARSDPSMGSDGRYMRMYSCLMFSCLPSGFVS